MRSIPRFRYMLLLLLLVASLPERAFALDPHTFRQGNENREQAGIGDSEEQRALESALREQKPADMAAQLETFLKLHPASAYEKQALRGLLESYETLGNSDKLIATADRLLKVDPDDLVALGTKTQLFLLGADQGRLQENLDLAKRGLRILRESGNRQRGLITDKKVAAMLADFYEVAGVAELRLGDFKAAQPDLRACVELRPDDFGVAYTLSLAYLQAEPPNPSQGLFFFARAVNLAPAGGREEADAFGREQYRKYYGSDHGWSALKELAKVHSTPPKGFKIPR